MRQVCIEASNESFAGNFGFYEQKKDEGEDKKKEKQAGSQGKERGHNIDGKRQEKRKRATSVKHLGGSFGTLPPARGHEIRKKCTAATPAAVVCEP